MKSFCKNLFLAISRKKVLPADLSKTQLFRCLSTIDLTFIGTGATLGAGIYVLTGEVGRNESGPAIVISFFIAAIASILSGLCYAEFAARAPKAGSAYVYCYFVVGELPAFVIGWDLLLEYMIGVSVMGRAVSTYIDALTGGQLKNKTVAVIGEINVPALSNYFDIYAFILLMFYSVILCVGVKNTSRLSSFCVLVNLITIASVIIAGAIYAEPKNWSDFAPFGVKGVIAGTSKCFFAFIGFDVIATAAEEAKNPARSIPLSMIGTITFCFLAYLGVGTVVTMMVPYTQLDVNAAVAMVFHQRNVKVMGTFISVGATAGLLGCTLISCLPPPRLLYALSQDGMIFSIFSRVSKRTGVPVIGTLSCGLFVALVAALLDLEALVDMLSIGTLIGYTIVTICVLILRYRPNDHSETKNGITNYKSVKDSKDNINREEAGDEEISINFHEQRTGFDNGFTLSNKTFSINMIILLMVVEEVILSVLLGEGCVKFDSNYQTIIADIAFVILILLVLMKGYHLSRLDTTANTRLLGFKVPFMPWIPILALFINVSLMLQLDRLTWYRFIVWLVIGLIFYFSYGIRHSKEHIFKGQTKDNTTDGKTADERSPLISPIEKL